MNAHDKDELNMLLSRQTADLTRADLMVTNTFQRMTRESESSFLVVQMSTDFGRKKNTKVG